jgi:hypothetical protein
MYLCLLNQDGESVLHRKMKAAPEPFLRAIAPSREGLVGCVEGIFTWYWRADLGAQEGMPFVLGHALSMKVIHGGKATHEQIDAQKMAVVLRGGRLPQADVYSAALRATRDLRRRRMPLMRKRAELLAHIHKTNSQDNLPEMGQKIAEKATRAGGAERCPEPVVPQRIDVDLTRIDPDDPRLRNMALSLLNTAKPHHATTRYLRRTVPGIGAILSLGLRDEIHDLQRVPRVQAFVSSCRRVTWAKASAGKRSGTSGPTLGKASLQEAVAEAAGLCRRTTPAGQTYLARVEKPQGKGKALTGLAQKLARAVSPLLPRKPACDMSRLRQCEHGAARVSRTSHWTSTG